MVDNWGLTQDHDEGAHSALTPLAGFMQMGGEGGVGEDESCAWGGNEKRDGDRV